MKEIHCCVITYQGDVTESLRAEQIDCPYRVNKIGNTELTFFFDQHSGFEQLHTNRPEFISESIDPTGQIRSSKWSLVLPKKPEVSPPKKNEEEILDVPHGMI